MLSDKVSHFAVRSSTQMVAAQEMWSQIEFCRVRARMPVYSVSSLYAIDNWWAIGGSHGWVCFKIYFLRRQGPPLFAGGGEDMCFGPWRRPEVWGTNDNCQKYPFSQFIQIVSAGFRLQTNSKLDKNSYLYRRIGIKSALTLRTSKFAEWIEDVWE